MRLTPTFWAFSKTNCRHSGLSKLSHVFAAGGEASATKLPRKLSLEERIQKARELRAQGASYKDIAQALGVTRGTALNYIWGYPYRK